MRQGSRPRRDTDLSSELRARYVRLFVRTAREICPGWEVVPQFRPALDAIMRWCLEAPGPLDPSKGLWLGGTNGTGKTTLLAVVKEYCRRIGRLDMKGNLYGYRITNVAEVCKAYEREGGAGIATYIESPRQAFDELGVDPSATGHFGTPLNVMQHVFLARYDRRRDSFTHVTTNLDMDQVREIYGPKVYDRIKEMFNFIILTGKSLRGGAIKPLVCEMD